MPRGNKCVLWMGFIQIGVTYGAVGQEFNVNESTTYIQKDVFK